MAGVSVMAISLQSGHKPRSGMCMIPPQINNKTKATFPHPTDSISQVTKYRNRTGYRSSGDKNRTASGQLCPAHFVKVRRQDGRPGLQTALPRSAFGTA